MTNPLNKSEVKWGIIYAIIQFFLLGDIALILNYFFQLPTWMLQVGIFFLNFLVTLAIFRRFLWKSCQTVLHKPFQIFGYAVLGVILYYTSTLVMSLIILLICPDYLNMNDAAISRMAEQSGIWITVGTVVFVPVAEECVFRGLCFRAVYDRRPVLAWILSVSLFSAVHVLGYIGVYDPFKLLLAFLQYLPAGCCLAFAYKQTDTIITPIVMHTCINFIGISLR